MRTEDVLAHFGTQQAVAKVLGITQPSVALWGEFPPPKRQLQLQQITAGTLKAESGCIEHLLGIPAVSTDAKPEQKAGA